MNPQDQNIRVTSDPLRNLIGAVGKGEYRVPQFQRKFVWEKQKVVELFDSIYKEYPIGCCKLEASRLTSSLLQCE